MFCLCPLSTLMRDHFDMRVDHPQKLIPLSSPVIQSTPEFWSPRELVSQAVPLQPPPPTHVLTKDASSYGWGPVCSPLTASGSWSSHQSSLHINFLELETALLTLKGSRGDCAAHTSWFRWTALQYALPEQGSRDQVQVLGLEGLRDYSVVSELEDLIVSGSDFGIRQCRGGSLISRF